MKKILMLCLALCVLATPALAKNKEKHKQVGDVVAWKTLPAAVQATVESAAAGGKINEVRRETKNNGVIYRAAVKTTDGKMEKIAVSEAGKLIKVKEDTRKKHKHKALFG